MPRQSSKILTPAQKKDALVEIRTQIKDHRVVLKDLLAERKAHERAGKDLTKRENVANTTMERLQSRLEFLRA